MNIKEYSEFSNVDEFRKKIFRFLHINYLTLCSSTTVKNVDTLINSTEFVKKIYLALKYINEIYLRINCRYYLFIKTSC